MTSCEAHTVIDDNGEYFLCVIESSAVVSATDKTCAFWQPAEQGFVKIPINQAIQHLIIGTKLFSPSDETSDITMLTLNLADNKWTEVSS